MNPKILLFEVSTINTCTHTVFPLKLSYTVHWTVCFECLVKLIFIVDWPFLVNFIKF